MMRGSQNHCQLIGQITSVIFKAIINYWPVMEVGWLKDVKIVGESQHLQYVECIYRHSVWYVCLWCRTRIAFIDHDDATVRVLPDRVILILILLHKSIQQTCTWPVDIQPVLIINLSYQSTCPTNQPVLPINLAYQSNWPTIQNNQLGLPINLSYQSTWPTNQPGLPFKTINLAYHTN